MNKTFVSCRRAALAAMLALGIAVTVSSAVAQTQVPSDATLTILATDPGPEATLARQQSFYVQFEVKNPTPVAVTIHALYKGQPVLANLGTSGVVMIPAGSGTGAAHFFYWGEKPTHIDEVRLMISDPKNTSQGKEFRFPVKLTWTAKDATAQQEFAPWVREWQQAEKARQKAEHEKYQKRMAESGPSAMVFSLLFSLVMGALLLAGFGLPIWGAFKWQGYWRTAAIVLGALPLLSLAYIIVGVSIDSTSHNLAPLELGIWLVVSVVGMLTLFAARFFVRRGHKNVNSPDGQLVSRPYS